VLLEQSAAVFSRLGITMNISSAIVYAKPTQEAALQTQLAMLDGVQVHAQTEDGRFIVTLECADDVQAIDLYKTIEHLPGALSVAMIFQQTEFNPEQELMPCK
jgi:nitrate reductase NapD